MSKRIKQISFLYKNERLVLKSNLSGKFRVPITSGSKTNYKMFTAQEVLELDEIRYGDPSLTLESGEKMRVFQGGDGSYLPAMMEGVLIAHDKIHENIQKPKKSAPTKKRTQDLQEAAQDFFDWYNDGYGS
tara:strand:+ start:58554 stop:58946 length:393 start_codon:yes stop_codon:yes gene_type:complete